MTDTLERREAIKQIAICGQVLENGPIHGGGWYVTFKGRECPQHTIFHDRNQAHDFLAQLRADAILALTTSPRVDEGRREVIEADLYECFSQGDCAWTVRQAVTRYVLDLALSLPAREVSGEREVVERARGLLCHHVDDAETRAAIKRGVGVGVWSMDALAAIRAALATTPAPREKLEADEAHQLAMEVVASHYGYSGTGHISDGCVEVVIALEAIRATLNRLSGEG